MSKTLIVNGIPFNYPVPGEEPGWGSGATGWASEVTEVLNNILGTNDILETVSAIANAQVANANVNSLVFDGGSVRKASISYAIYRISDSFQSGKAESGTMILTYDNNASEPWSWIICDINGTSGVNLSVTNLGQVQYTSSDIGSVNYAGVITFTAKCLNQ